MIDVEVDADRSIRTVTLDRPAARNALTVDGLEALEQAIADADESVIVLRGPAFCAGADLEAVAALDGDREAAIEFARLGQRVASAIEASPAVVVAGIDGPPAAAANSHSPATFGSGRRRRPTANPASRSDCSVPGAGRSACHRSSGGRRPRVRTHGESRRRGSATGADLADRGRPRTVALEIADNALDACAVLKRRIRDDGDRKTQERREARAFGDLVAAHADDVDAVLE